MSAHHLAFDAAYAHIGAAGAEAARRRREDVIASAAIRAMVYAVRGLPPATGCAAAECGTTQQPNSLGSLISSLPSLACAPGAASLQPRGSFLPGDAADGEGSDLD